MLQARGRMTDESGCLFGSWTLPEAKARGEKDKIAMLDGRRGKLHDFTREKWYGGVEKEQERLMPLMIMNI